MPNPPALAPVALASPCRPAMPCQLAPPRRAGKPCPRAWPPGYAMPAGPDCAISPALATPCRRSPAAPGQRASARPEALAGPCCLQPRPPRPLPPPGPLPLLSQPGPLPDAPAGPAGAAVRAVIGDQLRMPVMWCEMGSCISWHADPAALGEANTRAPRSPPAGGIDALGRLACPQCQQNDPRYRAARPVVPRDRYTAIARTARIQPRRAAAMTPAALPAVTPAQPGGAEWHHDSPADQPIRWQISGNPACTSIPRSAVFNAVRAWRARGGRQAAPRQASEPGEDLMIGRTCTPQSCWRDHIDQAVTAAHRAHPAGSASCHRLTPARRRSWQRQVAALTGSRPHAARWAWSRDRHTAPGADPGRPVPLESRLSG